MAQYKTYRKKVAEALAEKLQLIDGNHPYKSNVFDHVGTRMTYLDDIEEFPKICVIAGDESREYQPGGFKWRFLLLSIRVYVRTEDDPQEELSLLLEDIERVVDENDVLVYDDSVSPSLQTTSTTIQSITTDEGVIHPLGIGEMLVEIRY
tara:strand:+ start:140 stop:589 length:450 start_codon:yes stop_codon:yes gene_type:complete